MKHLYACLKFQLNDLDLQDTYSVQIKWFVWPALGNTNGYSLKAFQLPA